MGHPEGVHPSLHPICLSCFQASCYGKEAVLTDAIVLESRWLIAHNKVTLPELAQKYGLKTDSMRDAIKGRSWGHLPMEGQAPIEDRSAIQ